MWIKQIKYSKSSWSMLFPCWPMWDVTKVNWIKICQVQHTATENKSCCHCVAQVRKLFSSAHQSSPSNARFDLCRVLLRLMYDVSIESLSQSRTKPLSWDPSDQHVLSIWTLPAPHGLSFQFHSTAAMQQNQSCFFSLRLRWKSWCLWSLLWSLFLFWFAWSICSVPDYRW